MIFVSTACLKKNRISDIITGLAENGIKNIELSGGTAYYPQIEEDLLKLKKHYNLTYACHAYFPPPKEPFVVNLASCNDDIYNKSINHYEECIELLKKIQCNVLSIHAGFWIEIQQDEIGGKLNAKIVYDKNKACERFCFAYEYISKLCRQNSIDLYLENNVLNKANYESFGYNNYMMMTDYQSIMDMKSMLDFNLLLDLGHLYVSAHTLNLDYEKECDNLKKHVGWLHISENNGYIDEHKPLMDNSQIVHVYRKFFADVTDTTLETGGSVSEIIDSLSIVK